MCCPRVAQADRWSWPAGTHPPLTSVLPVEKPCSRGPWPQASWPVRASWRWRFSSGLLEAMARDRASGQGQRRSSGMHGSSGAPGAAWLPLVLACTLCLREHMRREKTGLLENTAQQPCDTTGPLRSFQEEMVCAFGSWWDTTPQWLRDQEAYTLKPRAKDKSHCSTADTPFCLSFHLMSSPRLT